MLKESREKPCLPGPREGLWSRGPSGPRSGTACFPPRMVEPPPDFPDPLSFPPPPGPLGSQGRPAWIAENHIRCLNEGGGPVGAGGLPGSKGTVRVTCSLEGQAGTQPQPRAKEKPRTACGLRVLSSRLLRSSWVSPCYGSFKVPVVLVETGAGGCTVHLHCVRESEVVPV